MTNEKKKTLDSLTDCAVCGQPLIYATEPKAFSCSLCGHEERTLIYCPAGHFVCDTCHSKDAIDVLKEILGTTTLSDPIAILEKVMAHPSIPMHGPEHHAMVPAILIAAVRNAGYRIPERAVEKAMERAGKVPGGWCGLYGDCGAAVGLGIAVSVLTGATPLTGKERSLALRATSVALAGLLDDKPRCCKRSSRIALQIGVSFLKEYLNILLPISDNPRCIYSARNKQCAGAECSFHESHF